MNRVFASEETKAAAMMDFTVKFTDYIKSYNDDILYSDLATLIAATLLYDRNMPLKNANHPFRLYAAHDEHSNNIRRLCTAVLKQIDDKEERQISVAFFHPGGSQRESLDELMENYYEFVRMYTEESTDYETE